MKSNQKLDAKSLLLNFLFNSKYFINCWYVQDEDDVDVLHRENVDVNDDCI